MRELYHSHYCDHCGSLFHSNRYDAKYCCSTCRTKSKRENENAKKQQTHAIQAVNQLIEGARVRDFVVTSDFETLIALKNRLDKVIQLFEIKS